MQRMSASGVLSESRTGTRMRRICRAVVRDDQCYAVIQFRSFCIGETRLHSLRITLHSPAHFLAMLVVGIAVYVKLQGNRAANAKKVFTRTEARMDEGVAFERELEANKGILGRDCLDKQ